MILENFQPDRQVISRSERVNPIIVSTVGTDDCKINTKSSDEEEGQLIIDPTIDVT